jgi:hypothetical protein
VAEQRLFSFYESACVIRDLWSYLMEFIDKKELNSSKVLKIREILGDSQKRNELFIKLNFIIDFMTPIHVLQKELEKGEPLIHKMYEICNVRVGITSKERKHKSEYKMSVSKKAKTKIAKV